MTGWQEYAHALLLHQRGCICELIWRLVMSQALQLYNLLVAHIDLAKSRREYHDLLDRSLSSVVEKLRQRTDVIRVSVFGSYARGRADLFTDLDILVIMETELPFVERQQILYQLLASPVDLDILSYTPQEFDSMKERPFLRHALRSEKILYEKKPA